VGAVLVSYIHIKTQKMTKPKKRAAAKYPEGTVVDTKGFGRLTVDNHYWNGFTWMYRFLEKDDLAMGEEYLKRVEFEKRTVDVTFTVKYTRPVTVTVSKDTSTTESDSLAMQLIEQEMAPYLDNAFFPHATFYPKSYSTNRVDPVFNEDVVK
jgi:hypothetical protein